LTGPLSQIRVVDLSTGVAGAFASRLLGDLGADILRMEDARLGHPLRRPVSCGVEGAFVLLNRGKSSLVTKDAIENQPTLRDMARWADIIVGDTGMPRHLASSLRRPNRRLVIVTVTAFGLNGPKSDWPATDLTVLAASGLLDLTGDVSREPLQLAGQQAYHLSGLFAAWAACVGVVGALTTGVGQTIDCSMQECVTSILEPYNTHYAYTAEVVTRELNRVALRGFGVGTPELRDGVRVTFGALPQEAQWDKFRAFLGNPAWSRHPQLRTPYGRYPVRAEVEARVQEALAGFESRGLYLRLQHLGIPMSPIQDLDAVCQSRQLKSRHFFIEGRGSQQRGSLQPGFPAVFSRNRLKPAASIPKRHRVRDLMAIGSDRTTQQAIERPNKRLPLTGTIVLDFTWVWSGPMCTLLLAQQGARVLKVESSHHIDLSRTIGPWCAGTAAGNPDHSGLHHYVNRGKESIAVNLATKSGLAIVLALVERADVVVDSFSPGTMDRLGLSLGALKSHNPDIIAASISGFGSTGPERHHIAYGANIDALSGLMALTGYAGGEPVRTSIHYSDPVAAVTAALSITASLLNRRKSGRGERIDLSMLESVVNTLSIPWAEFMRTGRVPPRRGNRSYEGVPHGVFPCKGSSSWIAISVRDDSEWRNFCNVLSHRNAAVGRWSTEQGRRADEDGLEADVGRWTSQEEGEELASRLRNAGVPAHVVQDLGDVAADPHLTARRFWRMASQSGVGRRRYSGPPVKFDGTPSRLARAPRLGEHTIPVLKELLGMPDSEIRSLMNQDVLA
jgi:crotonobetainyl-CoA:carnitine CoA-transferase CaiB-like acyl-CoA transferase